MGILSSIFYFVLVFGVLVIIHEFGHFIAARMSGMRVDIFSIGMYYRVFGWNKKSGFSFGPLPDDFDGDGMCDYRVSAIPLGGYVKIAGMIDESMDAKFAKTEPKPWEFRSKNPFQKGMTLSAGVIMNFLLTIVIFSFIILSQGETHHPNTSINYVKKNSFAEQIGFKRGDRIVSINNQTIYSWELFFEYLALDKFGDSRYINILRNGTPLTLHAEGKSIVNSLVNKESFGIEHDSIIFLIKSVYANMPAGKSKLKANDTIVTLNGTKISCFMEFVDILQDNKNKSIKFEFKRGNEILTDSITPDADGKIGVGPDEYYYGSSYIVNYGFFGSIGEGWNQSVKSIKLFINSFVQIFNGTISAKKSLGGPLAIAKIASEQAQLGMIPLLRFMAMLSLWLAVINILPIPALDGGHLIFVIVEAIIRREVSLKVKMVIQQVGVFLILGLMAFAFYNDIARLFGN
ncbi:MAG: RIP metalloprotease RseP [Candidatus Kapabacteria bacterium]|nr:RIP metalloprotease RseP [Candidatus Kapabacteria bacterium]